MLAIIKREIKNYMKNPVFYIGIILVFVQVYQIMAPFLRLHYWQNDGEIQSVTVENIADGDVTEGYLLSGYEQQRDNALERVREDLLYGYEIPSEKVDALIEGAKKHGNTEWETGEYLEEQCGYSAMNYIYWFQEYEIKKGSAEEVNHYMREGFAKENYTAYIGRKYADFMGLFLIAFSMILMAFLFIQDTKRNTYELLHTKPVTAAGYITGKLLGGFLTLLLVLFVFTAIFDVLAVSNGVRQGFPVSFFDIWKAAVIYIVPNLLMVVCVYTGVAILFKNPLPAAPLLFLYMVYSNMGSKNAEGIYGYYGRPLAILVRFPGRFMEMEAAPYAELNQLFLLAASAVIIVVTTFIWKRRRVY